MKKKIAAGLIAVAAAGGAMLVSPTAASASVNDPYECGFSRPYGAAYWNNCVDNDQLITIAYTDTLTNETFSEYICVEAQQVEMLMPMYFVWDGSVAASSC